MYGVELGSTEDVKDAVCFALLLNFLGVLSEYLSTF